MNWTTLVSVADVAACLDHPELRLFDARAVAALTPGGPDPAAWYAEGHIAGARFADLNEDLSDLGKTGLGRHPLPDADVFSCTLGQWGVTPGSQVVVYDASDGSMAAARLWWMMKLLGHDRVAVLDGGLAAWTAAGLSLTTQVPALAEAPAYPARLDRAGYLDAAEVQARLGESGWLIDVRGAERFRGEVEPIDPVAGHIPGAVNRPYALNVRDGRLKPPAELRAELERLIGDRSPDGVVLSCGSGVTAAHALLAFEHAGLKGPRVFAGSWSGWIADPSRPVEKD